MSETRQCKGKLTPIPFKEGEDLWDLKYRLLQEHNCTTPEFKNVRDRFDDMLSDQYFVRDGIIYKIHNVSMGDEICEAIENEDGSISYHLMWDSGGSCFDEMLDSAIDNLK